MGFPGVGSGKESVCQCKSLRRLWFNPWVRKIPWRRKWQSTPVFLPGKFHGQRSLAGLQSMGSQRVRHDWAHSMHAHTFLFISPKSTLTEKFQCIWTFDTKETILSLPFASRPHVLLHGLHIVGVHHSTASKPFPYLQLRTILCQATEGVVIWLIGFLPDYARLSPPGSASSPVSGPQRWARAPSPWNPPHFPPSLLIFFSPLPSSVRTK